MKWIAPIVEKRSVIARKILVFCFGYLMWRSVVMIRIVKAVIPRIALLMPRVFVYSEFWTIAHDEVSLPQSWLVGVTARRIEKARDIVKRVRRILYFMIVGVWICL